MITNSNKTLRTLLCMLFKGACSDLHIQSNPNFFKHLEIWKYQKLSHTCIYKALCLKFHAQNLCSLGDIGLSEIPSQKLENMIILNISSIYKHCFLWLITCKRVTNLQFCHLGWYIGLKSDHVCKFLRKKIDFPQISEQAPFN